MAKNLTLGCKFERFLGPFSKNLTSCLQWEKEADIQSSHQHSERWSGATRNWGYIDHVWLNPPKENIKKAA